MADANQAAAELLARRQKLYDMYYVCFSNDVGRAVLADMRERAWYGKSTMEGEGKDRGIRDAREGQRMFMLVTDDFIKKGREGMKSVPQQKQAISNTVEPMNVV